MFTEKLIRLKTWGQKSRIAAPLRWLFILTRLSELYFQSRRLNQEMMHLRDLLPGLLEEHELPFSVVEITAPLLARAEQRIGKPVAQLNAQEKQASFYTYFSEIWGEGYERVLERQYEAYFSLLPHSGNDPWLDIGCGAGEFIRFLGKKGIPAIGIDMDAQEIERAQSRGLNVRQSEAVTFLRETVQNYRGISLLEVIEHIPTESIILMLETAVSRLVSGGVLLIETINLNHPLALNGFYTDPTHVRPVPVDYLEFVMQWLGLVHVRVIFTSPVKTSGVAANNVRQVYYTYALIGVRP